MFTCSHYLQIPQANTITIMTPFADQYFPYIKSGAVQITGPLWNQLYIKVLINTGTEYVQN